MRLLTSVFLATAASCARGPTEVSLNQEFELAPGEAVRVAGSGQIVTFAAVGSDSRCPVDVACIWSGNALVQLRIRSESGDSVLELNTTVGPRSGSVGGIQVELRALEPAPSSSQPPPERRYRARLLVRGA